ncbi:hypothetical protein [Tepidibacillus marianensis]|uniref:hypothetical protein n=1 Tax=Tepidibacillus marianensis TaxID=3131995 RepID=UPI0030CBC25B
MNKSLKLYLTIVYSAYFFILIINFNNFDLKQLLETTGFIILMVLFNSEVVRDLQSNMSFLIVLPFVVPAFVFWNLFMLWFLFRFHH